MQVISPEQNQDMVLKEKEWMLTPKQQMSV
jgi:hypothetical protein